MPELVLQALGIPWGFGDLAGVGPRVRHAIMIAQSSLRPVALLTRALKREEA